MSIESVLVSGLWPYNVPVNQFLHYGVYSPLDKEIISVLKKIVSFKEKRLVWELVAVSQKQFCSENLPNEYWQVSYTFSIKPSSSGKCL